MTKKEKIGLIITAIVVPGGVFIVGGYLIKYYMDKKKKPKTCS
jgi:flagellar basal body-associated protein FliL